MRWWCRSALPVTVADHPSRSLAVGGEVTAITKHGGNHVSTDDRPGSLSYWGGGRRTGPARRRSGHALGDKIDNKAEELKGKAKEGAGKATDDKSLEAEGKTDQASGNVKQAGEKVKDAAKKIFKD